MNEFELIHRFLAPLAGEGAFGLKDDAALHHGMVITKDVLIDGVHFRTEDGWGAAAQKALRVNISDLVAKGAKPAGVFLGTVWPREVSEAEIKTFCAGLAEDIKAYSLNLLGGDTTRHTADSAPLMVSVTMTGQPGPRGPILRSGADPGDLVFVTGTIGDGWLGLQAVKSDGLDYPQSIEAYLRPSTPFALSASIAQYASAALDVSDGLAADAGHLATASHAQLDINVAAIPFSDEARDWLRKGGDVAALLAGGDDYQALMTINPAHASALTAEAAKAGIHLTEIGVVKAGDPALATFKQNGTIMTLDQPGFSHF